MAVFRNVGTCSVATAGAIRIRFSLDGGRDGLVAPYGFRSGILRRQRIAPNQRRLRRIPAAKRRVVQPECRNSSPSIPSRDRGAFNFSKGGSWTLSAQAYFEVETHLGGGGGRKRNSSRNSGAHQGWPEFVHFAIIGDKISTDVPDSFSRGAFGFKFREGPILRRRARMPATSAPLGRRFIVGSLARARC